MIKKISNIGISSSNNGFTLIEVLISASIILLAASCFTVMIMASAEFMRREETLGRAVYDAQNIMESLKSAKFEDLKNSSYVRVEQLEDDMKIIIVRAGRRCLKTIRAK